MTEEDVVRGYAQGRPLQEIIREIERREPGYELSPEMLEELRNVELPEPLIKAMQRRLDETQRAETQRLEQARSATHPVLTLHLNRERGGGLL